MMHSVGEEVSVHKDLVRWLERGIVRKKHAAGHLWTGNR